MKLGRSAKQPFYATISGTATVFSFFCDMSLSLQCTLHTQNKLSYTDSLPQTRESRADE